jgi:hypothetical protein
MSVGTLCCRTVGWDGVGRSACVTWGQTARREKPHRLYQKARGWRS